MRSNLSVTVIPWIARAQMGHPFTPHGVSLGVCVQKWPHHLYDSVSGTSSEGTETAEV